MNIRVGGKMHRTLAALASGRTFHRLINEAHPDGATETQRKKLWRRLDALVAESMAFKDQGHIFRLTAWGQDELQRLGEVPDNLAGEPNARVFVREARA